jgi:putative ABC transport system permease protein
MTYLYLRMTRDPGRSIAALRQAIAGVSRDLAPFDIFPLGQVIEDGPNGLLPMRLGSTFATWIGTLAVALTLLGLYGVIAYSVVQRTREIGLRMALGANRWSVARAVLARGAGLVGAGLSLGMVASLLLTRQLSALLVGVSVTEVTIFAGAALGLALVAMGSVLLPARRASGVDPLVALKAEG